MVEMGCILSSRRRNSLYSRNWSPIGLAAHKGNQDQMLSALGDMGTASFVATAMQRGVTAQQLEHSVFNKDYNALVELISSMANDEKDVLQHSGLSLIVTAGVKRDIAAVHILISNGFSPNGRAKELMSPVEWSLRYNEEGFFKALVLAGDLNESSMIWVAGDGKRVQSSLVDVLEKANRMVWLQ